MTNRSFRDLHGTGAILLLFAEYGTLEDSLAGLPFDWTAYRAATADECVRQALTDSHDVVLVDEALGGARSGMDVCREIRRFGDQVPLLVRIPKQSEAARERAYRAGADACVSKDLSAREVIACITEAISRPARRVIRECGPLRIDLRTMQVMVDGIQVDLTKTEHLLVLALTDRIGCTVGRNALCAFSGVQPTADFKNLQNHIVNVRKKLGRAGQLIRTDRTDGYRIARPPWPGFP